MVNVPIVLVVQLLNDAAKQPLSSREMVQNKKIHYAIMMMRLSNGIQGKSKTL